ncbi:hypothetical protein C6P86_26355 [Burkholderia multivorans]|nr:hypothetical protein C6P86_26355 [Burkholderia multivorans]PRE86070.1 hypothetical protein C6Q00_13545 [Burkholderia multivorans]PRG23710.1 hypothetical protein C6T57_11060 [Burkholderia multivorans]
MALFFLPVRRRVGAVLSRVRRASPAGAAAHARRGASGARKKKRDARKGIAHEPAWSADE